MRRTEQHIGDWTLIKRLGAGGQGVVHHVRSSDGTQVGALKQFSLRGSKKIRAEALSRIKREVNILKTSSHPNIVRLLDYNLAENWIVMEYLNAGTLEEHLKSYRGQYLEALKAFRPLVEAVAVLHAQGTIHRDIKLRNIFVSDEGRLVLGDFGLVYPPADNGSRLTRTNERVGSRDWIAPWADVRSRIDEPNARLDVFCLAKVLWCMLSGAASLPFWYHRRKAYDLRELFRWKTVSGEDIPDQEMVFVTINILDQCIVEHEEECLPSAIELLDKVDFLLSLEDPPQTPRPTVFRGGSPDGLPNPKEKLPEPIRARMEAVTKAWKEFYELSQEKRNALEESYRRMYQQKAELRIDPASIYRPRFDQLAREKMIEDFLRFGHWDKGCPRTKESVKKH